MQITQALTPTWKTGMQHQLFLHFSHFRLYAVVWNDHFKFSERKAFECLPKKTACVAFSLCQENETQEKNWENVVHLKN